MWQWVGHTSTNHDLPRPTKFCSDRTASQTQDHKIVIKVTQYRYIPRDIQAKTFYSKIMYTKLFANRVPTVNRNAGYRVRVAVLSFAQATYSMIQYSKVAL